MKHAARGSARQQQPGAGPARASAWTWLPYWVVLAGVIAGLLWIRGGGENVRSGTLVLAGVLLLAAVARMVLPERRAGLLGSRRRLADAAALGALGIGLLAAGLIFAPTP